MATADIEGDPLGEGIGDTLRAAVKAALEALGEPYASEMAESVTQLAALHPLGAAVLMRTAYR